MLGVNMLGLPMPADANGFIVKRPYFRQYSPAIYNDAFARCGLTPPDRMPVNGNPFLGLRGATQVNFSNNVCAIPILTFFRNIISVPTVALDF